MISRFLLERAAGIQACSSTASTLIRLPRISSALPQSTLSRSYGTAVSDVNQRADREEESKKRKRYALGGCLVTMFFSTHAILLWRRRTEFRALNKVMPAVEWSQFSDQYLAKGSVKSIVYQPHFHVGDAYLRCSEEDEIEKRKQHFLATFRAGPEKFARTPDVRFRFDGDSDDLELAIDKALAGGAKSCDIHLEVNRFPSYRELAFICMSTLFTLAAVGLMKI